MSLIRRKPVRVDLSIWSAIAVCSHARYGRCGGCRQCDIGGDAELFDRLDANHDGAVARRRSEFGKPRAL